MKDLLELQEKATKRVHWPTGLTYACEQHATALSKIALSMRIHIPIDDYIEGERLCNNCLNENSMARGAVDSKEPGIGEPQAQARIRADQRTVGDT
jgi:hypothetical protein